MMEWVMVLAFTAGALFGYALNTGLAQRRADRASIERRNPDSPLFLALFMGADQRLAALCCAQIKMTVCAESHIA